MQDNALYLLQLWADTFMMHQDTYPGFQKHYRQLKVEGIKFPERDHNERTIMDNLEGINSPMFEYLEQMEKKKNGQDVQLKVKDAKESNLDDYEEK